MKNEATGRQAELIDAAAKVFFEKGYAASSVQEVADEVGLLKGSLYHYIRTKEDLLFAVVEDAHRASMQIVEELSLLNADPAAELAAFVRAHLDLLVRERVKLSVYLHEARMLTSEHRMVVAEQRRLYGRYLQNLIERGQHNRTFVSRVDSELSTRAVLGMLNWTYEWYRDDDRDWEAVVSAFVQTALRAVGADGAVPAQIEVPPSTASTVPVT
ncbi:TetR/AcrR family transcriptional regulator [Arthrobacter sp. ISL-28]|uniref:TetR/AcrR family transcriptional regulator n=1 Tax=Arthrobacter sp. ISL-28 TaxID=2819108 RepID=UPI001BE6646B|nr:TetR/AcrR family transcriptional regulator [Arthrobacter sp. ISL-28]MBT2523315.1 TetR family transcriptional regulator [Arthrobacter sp. ISL-28]